MAEMIIAFIAVMLVSATYYIASNELAPYPRRNGASDPYACGEKSLPLEEASTPYPWLLLLFALLEAVPLATALTIGLGWHSVLLMLAAVPVPFLVLEEVEET